MTVFLHFPLPSPQCTSFFLQALLSRRYLPIKIAIFANFQKRRKMGVFVRQNSPLRNDFFCFFSHPSSWPVREVRFGPPNFDRGLGFHGDMTETKSAILRIFIKNIKFFTNQDMIEAISQNCTKTMVPMKKIDEINFEVHELMMVFHLLALIQVLGKHQQFGGQVC